MDMPTVLRYHNLDGHIQHFLPRVAEQPLGLCIDEHNAVVTVDHHNGIRQPLHEGAKEIYRAVQLLEAWLCPSLLGVGELFHQGYEATWEGIPMPVPRVHGKILLTTCNMHMLCV
jgi:hypothetical protein